MTNDELDHHAVIEPIRAALRLGMAACAEIQDSIEFAAMATAGGKTLPPGVTPRDPWPNSRPSALGVFSRAFQNLEELAEQTRPERVREEPPRAGSEPQQASQS